MRPCACLLTMLIVLTGAAHGQTPGRVSASAFGRTPEGVAVTRYTLRNASGMVVSVMSYGATITEIQAPDREGRLANVVLSADTLDAYVSGFGGAASVIGRVANRIAQARFTLDEVERATT